MRLKSFVITLLAALFVGHCGSFFTVWHLPYQQDPYTVHDMEKTMDKLFAWTNSLRDRRNGYRNDNEKLFAERDQALDRILKR